MRRIVVAGLLAGLTLSVARAFVALHAHRWAGGPHPALDERLVLALAVDVASGMLAALLLSVAAASLGTVTRRMGFVLALACFAWLGTVAVQWSDGRSSGDAALAALVELLIAWTAAGAVLSRILASEPPRRTTELRGAPIARARHPER